LGISKLLEGMFGRRRPPELRHSRQPGDRPVEPTASTPESRPPRGAPSGRTAATGRPNAALNRSPQRLAKLMNME